MNPLSPGELIATRRRLVKLGKFAAGCLSFVAAKLPQIAAITGHSLKQVEGIMETYFVRTYEMGAAAITKLEVHQDRLKDERN